MAQFLLQWTGVAAPEILDDTSLLLLDDRPALIAIIPVARQGSVQLPSGGSWIVMRDLVWGYAELSTPGYRALAPDAVIGAARL